MEEFSVESRHETLASIDAAVQDRTDKMERLHKEKVMLWRRRNALASISRLPEEILCEILLDVVRFPGTNWWSNWPQQWLTVSHVCHHWWEVVLAFPQFWDHVVLEGPGKFLEMFLERSGQVPLTITVSALQELSSDVFRVGTLQRQAHRIRSLSGVAVGQDEFTKLLVKALANMQTTFSVLEILSISFETSNPPPDLITSKTMPHLRCLSCFDPSMSFLQSICDCPLTTLRIRSWGAVLQDVAAWANVIKNFDTLQTLDLGDVFPHLDSRMDDAFDSFAKSPAHLPKLQTLKLSGRYHPLPYARFIECCTFPRTTKVRLDFEFKARRYMRQDDVRLMSSLSSSASRLGLSFTSCYTHSDAQFTFQLNLWEDTISAPALHEAKDPAWQLSFPAHATQRIFEAFLSEFPLPRLHSLSIFAVGGTSYEKAFTQLDRHPTIRELTLDGHPLIPEFLRAAHQPSVLPGLELLYLRDATLWKNALPKKQHKGPSHGRDLEEMLRVRTRLRIPVKQLRVDVSLLRGYDTTRIDKMMSISR